MPFKNGKIKILENTVAYKGVQSTSLFAFKIAYISEKQSNNVIEKRYSVFNENPECLLGKNKLEKRKQRESPYV